MGWFNKIRNILFEEDPESEMPDYSKKEEKIVKKEIKRDIKNDENDVSTKVDDLENLSGLDAIRAAEDGNRRRVVKRDVDVSFDEVNPISEVPGSAATMPKKRVDYVPEEKPKERKPIFQNFDEEEFDRLNSHITSNERKRERLDRDRLDRERAVREDISINEARKANSNYSSTTMSKDNYRDPNRYKIEDSGTKKPFTPSPVISPVYGILDKNYSKDDIVDKKDGIKREIVKPINRQEISSVREEKEREVVEVEVSIDSIRNKAFGAIEDLEKKAMDDIYEEKVNNVEDIELPYVKDEPEEKIEEVISHDEDEDIDDLIASQVDEVDKEEELLPLEEEEEGEVKPRRKIMDDVEKTSTLQILDDIEKELNSYKPQTSKNDVDEENEDVPDETLEHDLFNLIDSMYDENEKGEEDDD